MGHLFNAITVELLFLKFSLPRPVYCLYKVYIYHILVIFTRTFCARGAAHACVAYKTRGAAHVCVTCTTRGAAHACVAYTLYNPWCCTVHMHVSPTVYI